ncbi:hypothetical protein BZA77DRAFT_383744 [Pyronema omphalodes]|nr:hypothetical protein BZA77DRAFT_383744 [Pyronema omphalodes]
MSTFKGIVSEFPGIRIDYFRGINNSVDNKMLAGFLSHIHSDHLQGLESSHKPAFIYCSAATKELLVKLQRKVHRLNLHKGVVETENCQYKAKESILKAIPLETPTWVEVGPEMKVRVTLFDANHCVGAVMFLIEGNGKAILYTGDMRAEDWLIDYLARHPIMLPYTTGIKRLDKIYLDTSCGIRGSEMKFPSKREGTAGLLKQLEKYPKDTIFHLNTWTFGYEDVWVALAAHFNCQIHLNRYHYNLFMSLKDGNKWSHGPFLCGFDVGNVTYPKIITTNPNVKIHSCERNTNCEGLNRPNVVYITPVVAVVNGELWQEDGIDYGDLNNNEDFSIEGQFKILLDLLGDDITLEALDILTSASKSRKESIPLPYPTLNETITKADILSLLQSAAIKKAKDHAARLSNNALHQNWPGTSSIISKTGELLPTWIQFPYSRHSSLGELRAFVAAFRPKDVYQNTCDETTWTPQVSVETLYGDLCSERIFAHDNEMRNAYQCRVDRQLVEELNQHKRSHLGDFQSPGMEYTSPKEPHQPLLTDTAPKTPKEEEKEEEKKHTSQLIKTEIISSSMSSVSISLEHYTTQRHDSEITPSPRSIFLRGKPEPPNGPSEPFSSPPNLPTAIKLEEPSPDISAGTLSNPLYQSSSPSESIKHQESIISPEGSRGIKRRKITHDRNSPEAENNPLPELAELPPLPPLPPLAPAPTTNSFSPSSPPGFSTKIPYLPQTSQSDITTSPQHPPPSCSNHQQLLTSIPDQIAEIIKEDKSLDEDMITEAISAALGIGNETWWDVELSINGFRCVAEEEL